MPVLNQMKEFTELNLRGLMRRVSESKCKTPKVVRVEFAQLSSSENKVERRFGLVPAGLTNQVAILREEKSHDACVSALKEFAFLPDEGAYYDGLLAYLQLTELKNPHAA